MFLPFADLPTLAPLHDFIAHKYFLDFLQRLDLRCEEPFSVDLNLVREAVRSRSQSNPAERDREAGLQLRAFEAFRTGAPSLATGSVLEGERQRSRSPPRPSRSFGFEAWIARRYFLH